MCLFSQYFPSTTPLYLLPETFLHQVSLSNSNFLMSPTFPIFQQLFTCISLHIVTKMLMWHIFRISKFRDWILENVTSWEVVISGFKSRQTKIICWKVTTRYLTWSSRRSYSFSIYNAKEYYSPWILTRNFKAKAIKDNWRKIVSLQQWCISLVVVKCDSLCASHKRCFGK